MEGTGEGDSGEKMFVIDGYEYDYIGFGIC